jgi:hypothetical protein
MSFQQSAVNFPHTKISGNQFKPKATLDNLAVLLKESGFKIQFCHSTNDFTVLLNNVVIGNFSKNSAGSLGLYLAKNPHLISLCNEYELSPTVLRHFLCEVLKNYPVEIIPVPDRKATTDRERGKQHIAKLRAVLNGGAL